MVSHTSPRVKERFAAVPRAPAFRPQVERPGPHLALTGVGPRRLLPHGLSVHIAAFPTVRPPASGQPHRPGLPLDGDAEIADQAGPAKARLGEDGLIWYVICDHWRRANKGERVWHRADPLPHSDARLAGDTHSIFRIDATLLLLEHVDQFPNAGGTLVQHGLLFGRELDLVDLLNARGSELDRNSHVETVDAILAFQIGGAG